MALSIKTEEADRLARELARKRDVSITEAVTQALREACAREVEPGQARAKRFAELREWLDSIKDEFDRTPVSEAEWDEAGGEAAIQEAIERRRQTPA